MLGCVERLGVAPQYACAVQRATCLRFGDQVAQIFLVDLQMRECLDIVFRFGLVGVLIERTRDHILDAIHVHVMEIVPRSNVTICGVIGSCQELIVRGLIDEETQGLVKKQLPVLQGALPKKNGNLYFDEPPWW